MVPTFGLQAHFPAQIEWVGQTATKLASSMNSTVQAGSSKQVANNPNPTSWTQPHSAFDLSSHLLLQNVRIGQSQSMLPNSMISTCQVGGSDQASTGTVACIPWNISHSCADQLSSTPVQPVSSTCGLQDMGKIGSC